MLRAATIEGARYAGQGGDAGTVTVGKCADLVLLKGDPLADIANLRRTRSDPGRRLYDRARLDALLALMRGQAGRCMSGRSCFGFCVQFGEGRPA